MSMEKVLSFLWNWRYPLLVVLGFAVYVAVNWRRAWAQLRELAPKLMLVAQKRAQELLLANGEARMAWVVQYILTTVVPTFPAWLRPWLTEQRVRAFAQCVYDTAVDLLDDGWLNSSATLNA